ncbi:glycoside hydrolase family 43 protein [candidate division KSB1 bacterium]|nr:glycoside hydrolase family 43 protein [candidate division KSB1 bacterium]
MKIKNPILPGFNPDPSIIRVDDDYFIATSTFEWFPGVQIHHSKDLINWKLITRPLNRTSQLNMAGNPNSCGIWAPCLSFGNGTFYLIYTDVKTFKGIFKDAHNYLVTTNDICGDWSEPVYLNSSGFDASLFHDDDGKKWLVNMIWDHRKNKHPFGGILLQEYSPEQKKLIGPVRNIFKGTEIQKVEGPHLYRRNGYYYLMTAEGGTVFRHAVTIARSKNIAGPYQVDPQNPVLTSYNNPTLELQRAGHASLVETQNDEFYMVHLCGRHLPARGRCIMGRETAIQKMKWTNDGWLRLEVGGNEPQVLVDGPDLPEHKWEEENSRDNFDSTKLNINFQFLRVDISDLISLTERPGFLRLKGGESLSSFHKQALIARRQQSFFYTAETGLDFEPETFQQMAGLICLYDNNNFYYLYITTDEELGKCIDIMTCIAGDFDYPLQKKISVNHKGFIYLRAEVDYDKLRFSYSENEVDWKSIGLVFDASTLSDEFDEGGGDAHFTGAFVGLCCQDLSGMKKHADFDYFEYKERLS